MTDPDIMADDDFVRPPFTEKRMITRRLGTVVLRAISEAMKGRAIYRMIGRSDPDCSRDGANFPICASATMQDCPM
jgi:hypothetical protein